jgi:uncharacterized membrane protein YsdA (DUF1294 family)/cold shock CspA family protein
MASLNQGTLITWKPDKGFGFIRPQDGSKDVFVHVRDFGNIGRPPKVGDEIRYQRIRDRTGRYRAADVQVSGVSRSPDAGNRPLRKSASRKDAPVAHRSTASAVRTGMGIGIVLALLVAFTALPVAVPLLYLVASLAAFLLYAFDKAAAMNRRQRTRELTLLLVGLAGGWPGALIAQNLFRHKTRKTAFQVPFWITVAFNCAFLAWACTKHGAEAIRLLIY